MRLLQLKPENMAVVLEKLDEHWNDKTVMKSHWNGCEFVHYGCAIKILIEVIRNQQDKIAVLLGEKEDENV